MNTIQEIVNNHFIKMCEQGNLAQVKYWLEHGDLQIKAQINAEKDCAILSACCMGHLDIVKYLLTSDSLEIHANIHNEQDAAFRFAYAKYFSPYSPTKKIIEYLVIEYNISLTKHIQKELNLYPNSEVLNMFNKRESEILINHKYGASLSSKNHLFLVKK